MTTESAKQIDSEDIVSRITPAMIKAMHETYVNACMRSARMSIGYPAGLAAYHQALQKIEGMSIMLEMLGVSKDDLYIAPEEGY